MSVEYNILLNQKWTANELQDLLIKEFPVPERSTSHPDILCNDALTIIVEETFPMQRKLCQDTYGFDAPLAISTLVLGKNGDSTFLDILEYFLGFYDCDMHYGVDTGIVYAMRRNKEILIGNNDARTQKRLAAFCEENDLKYTVSKLANF